MVKLSTLMGAKYRLKQRRKRLTHRTGHEGAHDAFAREWLRRARSRNGAVPLKVRDAVDAKVSHNVRVLRVLRVAHHKIDLALVPLLEAHHRRRGLAAGDAPRRVEFEERRRAARERFGQRRR